MGQRSVPAPFLTKTYELVGDPGSDEVISWGENGESFVVWKTADFARDLLPSYFKHNNFSSFVRQLNTYGFRKVVPDKWEFANDNFKKGQPQLLSKIRRRKAVPLPNTAATTTTTTSKQQQRQHHQGNSTTPALQVVVNNGMVNDNHDPCEQHQTSLSGGDDMGSTSTSSQGVGAPGSLDSNHHPQACLTDENEKLRRDNESLMTELKRTKKQCHGLVAFLSNKFKVGSDQICRIMHGSSSTRDEDVMMINDIQMKNNDDDDDNDENEMMEECSGDNNDNAQVGLKLFGVLLKGCKEAANNKDKNQNNNNNKRARSGGENTNQNNEFY